jgi:hypothetical protein
MTTQTDNGGPAFPAHGGGTNGMTLRDYFAAAALHSMDYGWFDSATRIREMVAESYEIADAMIAARKEGA